MMYIKSPELIHLIAGSLYPLTNAFPAVPTLPLSTTTIYFYKFGFFRFHI